MLVKKKRNMVENKTQKAALQWLKYQHPIVFQHVIKIDNEGATGRAEAIKCGLHVGASDLFIAWPTKQYHGLWIEVKPEGWKLTKSKQAHYDRQMAFIDKMNQRGYYAKLCVGIDECIEAMKNYLEGTI